ncbi:MAG: putative DNA binding domain-containing protein [Bryobacterales bacterium]|nr:putative DNA binding domain-containing protein [Bryobacterales bacterium]
MTVGDEDIRQRLALGADSRWEFKQVEFAGSCLTSPSRDDLADDMIAFANANGGTLLLGVTDDGHLQGLSREQMAALNNLIVEVSTDSIEPAPHIDVNHREVDSKALVVVDVPRGDSLHERRGRSWIRVGASKRPLTGDERTRLAQRRAQARYLWYDRQTVPNTGFETLSEQLWEPLLSVAAAAEPIRGLANMRLLARDEADVLRATVAGLLLCAKTPQQWLPQAVITATHYRGKDRASEQLDAQEIEGPLPSQIADGMKFVARNMRVAARKSPARENIPQYSTTAVFEALVNAVAHRDYSVTSRRIRLSMFLDRLEIDTPGQLPNGMTIESMHASQATRNETIASVFGRIPVGDVPGSAHHRYLMERRGDGVAIIFKETQETAGIRPEYSLVGESSLVLSMPAAKLDLTPAEATIAVHADGEPLPGIDVLVLFPNNTWRQGKTDEAGEVAVDLHSTHLPMTVYAAAPGFAARRQYDWIPQQGGLALSLERLKAGGSVIFPEATGHVPGLGGRLNPIRDTADRTYLYADNIAIEQGRQQPVHFRLGSAIRLMDAFGVEFLVTIVDIVGKAALVEYRPLQSGGESHSS